MTSIPDTPEPAIDLDAWAAPGSEHGARADEALRVNVDGFDGPLDMLLALARTQKVDLSKISVLALAEQYLAFIAQTKSLRIELAADYLVMAAWLAFLKSRLILPREAEAVDTVSGEELAARLAFRLMRLDAMRNASAQLMTRKRLGLDVFARGMPEGVKTIRERQYTAEIFDLLKAYSEQRSRTTVKRSHVVRKRTVWSIKDARTRLEKMVGASAGEWVQLDMFLDQYIPTPELAKTAVASSFGATLEMARDGVLELRQDAPFAPIHMRRREPGSEWQVVS